MDAPTGTTISTTQPTETPVIGLALGGGVARGWAHIGALSRLGELGIRPDIICGTSVGALVGGFFSAGHMAELESWARALNKRRMLSYFDVMISGSGLMGGKRLQKTMRKYLGEIQIEDLPNRFVAITAELSTGHETWIRRGNLCDAIEASYALPGIFPPRNINGRWQIDGALINPLPVNVCRALGARMVIAVGLHGDAFGRAAIERREKFDAATTEPSSAPETLLSSFLNRGGTPSGNGDSEPGLPSTLMASFNIIMDRTTRSRLAGDPPDVLALPEIGHISLWDFDRADELIALGRQSIDDCADAIEHAMKYLA